MAIEPQVGFSPDFYKSSAVLCRQYYYIVYAGLGCFIWDLPYWKTNMIRHNLNVMHIEKNVFDNIFNTLLCVPSKTKDHIKGKHDLRELGIRSKLHPIGPCTLKPL